MIRFILLLNVLICTLLLGCKQSIENKTNISEDYNRDSLLQIFNQSKPIKLSFFPKDTSFYIKGGTFFRMYKDAFNTANGEVYKGRVILAYSYEDSLIDLIKNVGKHIATNNPDTASIFRTIAFLKIKATDTSGITLNINPNNKFSLFFPVRSRIGPITGWGIKDTGSNSYFMPLAYTKKLKPYSLNESLIPPIEIDGNLRDSNNRKLINKNHKITRSEYIGSVLTLNNAGVFIFGQEYQGNLEYARIFIDVKNSPVEGNLVKIVLMDLQEELYLTGKHMSGARYAIYNPGWGDGYLIKLPLNRKYTLLAYAFKDNKTYYYLDRSFMVSENTNSMITLREVNFEKFKTMVEDMSNFRK